VTADLLTLRGDRYVPPALPEEWARRVRAVLDNRSAVRGFMEDPLDPVGNVRRCVPDAWRIFGEATITAGRRVAAGRRVPLVLRAEPGRRSPAADAVEYAGRAAAPRAALRRLLPGLPASPDHPGRVR
jgi:hypothetical protein